MSKKAAEHHKQSAEHHTHAARHHGEAAKHHEGGHHEKAAHQHTPQGDTRFTLGITPTKLPSLTWRNTARSVIETCPINGWIWRPPQQAASFIAQAIG
jgi:hypothetical protein